MKKFLSKILYYPLWGVWYALSVMPLRVHYLFADVTCWMLTHVIKYRRKVILKNLANSFPEMSEQERTAMMHSFYHFFCDYIAETVKFGTMSIKSVKKHITFNGADEIVKIVNEGQDVALFLGHYGNWEWVTSIKQWVNDANNLAGGHIYHPLENEAFDRLFLSFRNRMESESIPMKDTLRWLINNKQAGKVSVVGYIADQVPTWHNIHHWLTFFNQETPVFTGVERIARKFNQAVVYVDVKVIKRGYYQCDLQVVTRDPSAMPENEITNECFRRLENTIRRAPQYWLWSHNRWKRTRAEFDRRFKVVNGHVVEK